MKIINNLEKILFLLSVSSLSINAQDFSKAGTSAGQFLKIPVGAKAISMASTFTSVANDISSLYWNPSGIASLNKFEIGFSHSQWIADIHHNFLGIVLPLSENSTIGVSVIQLSSGEIESTTIDKPSGTGTYFDATDLAISISYAQYLIEQVSVGISAKYINQRIWNTSASTFAFDMGVLLHTGFYGMKMGLSFQNFGPELAMDGSDLIRTIDQDPFSTINPPVEAKLETQPYSLPTSYRASVSMPIVGENAPFNFYNSSFIVAIDAIHSNDNPEHYSVGSEYGFSDVFFLRTGYIFNTDEEGLTFGSGVIVNMGTTSVSFDYAYASFGVFDAIHVFSLSLKL